MHTILGCKLVQPQQKSVQRILKMLKIQPPYKPAILPLGRYAKEGKEINSERDTCTILFIAVLFKTGRKGNNLRSDKEGAEMQATIQTNKTSPS